MSARNAAALGRDTEGKRESSVDGRNLNLDSISDLDLDAYLDPADRLMLAAVRSGLFVLAVRCRVCGAPLTARRSRVLGIGPACRKRVAE